MSNKQFMKKMYFLLLFFTTIIQAQIVTIPDANFKEKLLLSNISNGIAAGNNGFLTIDSNNDGDIQTTEALAVEYLDISNSNIIDLTGLLSFTNLKFLYCFNNNLTSLDLNALTHLERVDCYQNALTSIHVNNLMQLKRLDCTANALPNLNVNGMPNLEDLRCGSNQLTSLNLLGTMGLKNLICSFNQLTAIDLSGQLLLEAFDCQQNLLTSLDLSSQLFCPVVWCNHNQLQSLFVKNGIQNNMIFYNNPDLVYVCGDASEQEFLQSLANSYGLTNCVVNSYCTTTPGGNYNKISGILTFDNNQNGCDLTDDKPNNIRLNINDGLNSSAVFTDSAGLYKTYMQEGSFEVKPFVENPTWFTFSPTAVNIPFANSNNNTATQDFCISPNGFHPDVEVLIFPIFFARPGFDATYQITFKNKGNYTYSEGIVGFQFDDAVLDFVSASQAIFSQSVGNVNWQYTNLLPFESRSITVTLNVNSPTETPAVNIGDLLNFVVSTFPLEADENPLDNTFEYIQTVVGSYDPNDITCLEGDVVAPSEIGNYLHYAINFENTGTFPAENVVVKTEVDAAKFDIGSLQLMNTNFPLEARISGNKVEFIFENIQLPIGVHGHILLKIKTNETLVVGDAVANRADIFFDYNFPIDTGLANTVFQTLSNDVFEVDSSIAVYPNPATTEVTVKSNNNIKSIQLYDVQGRIITASLTDTLESKIDVSNYGSGIYFIKIITEKGMQVQKLLKE